MLEEIVALFLENKKRFLGGFIGFIIAILFLTFGFFATIFIIVLTIIGYIIGDNEEIKNYLYSFIERLRK